MSNPVGILPAAGLATRLHPYRGCKELVPLPVYDTNSSASWTLRPLISHSLKLLHTARVRRAVVVVNANKVEIARQLASGQDYGIDLAYVCQDKANGMVEAILRARPWMDGSIACLAMPDTLIVPETAMLAVLKMQHDSDADVVLGVFPTSRPHELGPVRISKSHEVEEVFDKPAHTSIMNTWAIACWRDPFYGLLEELHQSGCGSSSETVLGSAFQRAVEAGLQVRAVSFLGDGDYFHDLGTASGFMDAHTRLLNGRRGVD